MKPFRHTRITFTIGPATESEAQLEAIIKAGANVVRLNMAHADHAWVRTIVARVREVSRRLKKELAVMMDIKGPEIRTGARKEPTQLAIDQVVDVSVLLTVEKMKEKDRRQRAEVTLHVKGRDIFVEHSDEDLYAAIDQLMDKLDRQVVRHKDRVQDHHHVSPKRLAADAG